jgi:nucleotide-binding universal stress UspA family protein
MNVPFRVIGLAISFSPTTQAMVAETSQLVKWFQSDLVLIHVGKKDTQKTEALQKLIDRSGVAPERISVFWVEGDPADQILKVCHQQKVDLLVAGALKKENLVNHYLSSVARKIMRKAKCSIWMITEPTTELKPLKNIVVDAESSGSASMHDILNLACTIASKEQGTWVHIVRELKLLGLALSAREQCTESEYDELKQNMAREETTLVEKELDRIPHRDIKTNIKLLSGKSGFELAQFAKKKSADLLIINAPPRRFSLFDRIFTHDQEYIFSDLPCNLLVIQSTRKS